MTKYPLYRFHALMLTSAIFAATAHSSQDFSKPVIRKETRTENGKPVEYMFIDGVKVHESDPTKEPPPPVVEPLSLEEMATRGKAPADAIVLFDGTEASFTSQWTDTKGEPSKWVLVDGAMESVKGAGYIQTREKFGSCHLHIEFATPATVKGSGQGRGNSGVFIMGQYEIQVLDSYENPTYPDGQCGALYGRKKPLVNASRKPGEWQSYDIEFHRPLFDDQGNVTRRAVFTVYHNGVLIHDKYELSGGTGWRGPHSVSEYKAHGDKGPISLQDHGNPVRYRNVWIRPIAD